MRSLAAPKTMPQHICHKPFERRVTYSAPLTTVTSETTSELLKAVEFYSSVMGWYQIVEPTVIKEESDTPIGQMCIDVFGAGCRRPRSL